MVVCVAIGTVTGAIFLVVLLFVSGSIDDVISSSAGPLLQILIHATNSNVGGICLLMYVQYPHVSSKVLANVQASAAVSGVCNHERHDDEQPHDFRFCAVRLPFCQCPC